MTKLHFNFKDMFRAFRLGFSAKKIWAAFVGLFFAWLGYTTLTYLAYLLAGAQFSQLWDVFRLLPIPGVMIPNLDPAAAQTAQWVTFAWWNWFIWGAGVFWLTLVALVSGVAISKLTYEQLRGDEFFELKDAWKTGIQGAKALFFTPFILVILFVVLFVAGIFLGVIGKIRFVGELIAIPLIVFGLFVALFMVFMVLVTFFSFTISPAIIGSTKSDTFDNLFEVFSCVNDQPWRLIWYQFLLVIFSVVGMAVFAFFIVKGFQIVKISMGTVMNNSKLFFSYQPVSGESVQKVAYIGQKLNAIFNIAAGNIKLTVPDSMNWLKNAVVFVKDISGAGSLVTSPGIFASAPKGEVLTPEVIAAATGHLVNLWSVKVSAFILTLIFQVAILAVLGYGMSVWFSGNTMVYLILVKKKDQRNLLEIHDEEIEIPEKLDISTGDDKKEESAESESVKKPVEKKTKPKKTVAKKTTTKKKATPKKKK